jgi:hypothetical protein
MSIGAVPNAWLTCCCAVIYNELASLIKATMRREDENALNIIRGVFIK